MAIKLTELSGAIVHVSQAHIFYTRRVMFDRDKWSTEVRIHEELLGVRETPEQIAELCKAERLELQAEASGINAKAIASSGSDFTEMRKALEIYERIVPALYAKV